MFLFQSRDRVVRQKLPWRNTFSNARAIGRTRKFSIDTPVLLLNLYWAVGNANSHIKIFELFVGIKIYYRSKKNRSTSAVVRLCGKYVVLSGKYLSMITSLTRNLGFRERQSSETCKTLSAPDEMACGCAGTVSADERGRS